MEKSLLGCFPELASDAVMTLRVIDQSSEERLRADTLTSSRHAARFQWHDSEDWCRRRHGSHNKLL